MVLKSCSRNPYRFFAIRYSKVLESSKVVHMSKRRRMCWTLTIKGSGIDPALAWFLSHDFWKQPAMNKLCPSVLCNYITPHILLHPSLIIIIIFIVLSNKDTLWYVYITHMHMHANVINRNCGGCLNFLLFGNEPQKYSFSWKVIFTRIWTWTHTVYSHQFKWKSQYPCHTSALRHNGVHTELTTTIDGNDDDQEEEEKVEKKHNQLPFQFPFMTKHEWHVPFVVWKGVGVCVCKLRWRWRWGVVCVTMRMSWLDAFWLFMHY